MSARTHHRSVPVVAAPGCTAPTAACRHTPGARHAAGRLFGVGLVGLALVATACGDDSATVATVAEIPATTAAAGPTVTVRAMDFAYQDLPAAVSTGTRFTLDNTAATELHEMVAIPIADDETRPIGELVQDDLETLLTSAPPAFVVLAPPGSADPIVAVGDGVLTTPGRYALVCMIPTGVDPGVYLDAAAASNGGPPQVDGGPPHLTHGMFAEITVMD